jgi:hypothetical protein
MYIECRDANWWVLWWSFKVSSLLLSSVADSGSLMLDIGNDCGFHFKALIGYGFGL